jgi:branched-chain amino acid aminotransferase
MPTVKSLNYIPAIMGQRKCARRRRHRGALLRRGWRHHRVYDEQLLYLQGRSTDHPCTGCAARVTRAAALEVAGDLFEIVERPILRDELAEADEAFITSTTKEIMPIVRVDAQSIGAGRPGARTQRLRQSFQAYVAQGSNPLFHQP